MVDEMFMLPSCKINLYEEMADRLRDSALFVEWIWKGVFFEIVIKKLGALRPADAN